MPSKVDSASPVRSLLQSVVALLVLLAVLFGAFLCGRSKADRGQIPEFEGRLKKERLVARMQLDLLVSAEAEKNAVMAETDEGSESFAEESRKASAAVEAGRRELESLIDPDARPEQTARLDEFSQAWKRHQELDREILDLAVENTNLKAMRLSFISAADALRHLEVALTEIEEKTSSSPEAASIHKPASQALIAALKVHALESRHIAEARDEEMNRIEEEMKGLDNQAGKALDDLTAAAGEPLKANVDGARAAYAEFQGVNSKIIELSRRNSNVRSLALSLGEKRQATANCRDLLNALRESLQTDEPTATR